MSEPPTRLCCGQKHFGNKCPDGKVMCCLCFDRFDWQGLHVDEEGSMWDVCKACAAAEKLVAPCVNPTDK